MARKPSRGDVFTLATMPAVEPVSFFLSDTTAMRTRSSGQWLSGATCTARLSEPSSLAPMLQRTKPPYRERQAEPEPMRAMVVSSPS